MYKRKRLEIPRRYLDNDSIINGDGILISLSHYNINDTNIIPDVATQNCILRHVRKKDRTLFIEKYGIFHTTTCKYCVRQIHLYMHVDGRQHDTCSACYRLNRIKRRRCHIEDDSIILSSLKEKIYNITIDGYDNDKNYIKCKNAVENRNIGLITLYSKYTCSKFKCTECSEYKFISEYHTEIKTKKGIQTKCNLCNTQSKDCLIYKINLMLHRAKKKGIEIEQNMPIVEMINRIKTRQNNLDYYTMVPLEYVSGSPFSPSPERIDRVTGYLIDNTSLCFQILNVGGENNWTRKLTLQIYFANEFIPERINLYTCSKLLYMYKQTIHRSKIRGKKKKRKDNSGNHSLTFKQCIELILEQDYRCALSNLPLVFEKHHLWMASIDRKDPTEGYHKWNCRIVIYRLNMGITWTDKSWTYFHTQLKNNIGLVIEAEGFGDNVKSLNDNTFKLLNKDILTEQNATK